jgi:hypothetical protein
VISLLGMLVMGVGFVTGLAVGAAMVVTVTVAASLTLLPALLGFAGTNVERTRWRGLIAAGLAAVALLGVGLKFTPLAIGLPLAVIVLIAGIWVKPLKREVRRRPQPPLRETFAYRWSRSIQHHPWRSAIGAALVLVVLALPVLSMRLGFSDESNYAEDTSTRKAYDLLVEGFGPGFNGPMLLVTDLPDGYDPAQLDAVDAAVRTDPGVAFLSPVILNNPAAPTAAFWNLIPTTGPQDQDTDRARQAAAWRPVAACRGLDRGERERDGAGAGERRLLRLPRGPVAVLLPRRARAVVPAADDRVPVAAGAAEGGDHEPAVDRRGVRHRRRAVPVGLAQRHHRRAAGTDRAMDPDDAVRHHLRTLDGLRGVPPLTRA